jgi:c-di-AMP phosphodiesterase-like protein
MLIAKTLKNNKHIIHYVEVAECQQPLDSKFKCDISIDIVNTLITLWSEKENVFVNRVSSSSYLLRYGLKWLI